MQTIFIFKLIFIDYIINFHAPGVEWKYLEKIINESQKLWSWTTYNAFFAYFSDTEYFLKRGNE